MGIIRVWIEEGCVTCGNSEEVCPEIFEIDIEAGTAVVNDSEDFLIGDGGMYELAELFGNSYIMI